jgi:PHD/YefM family antitoxin component YafN of YafNO toxin-antitoxin module
MSIGLSSAQQLSTYSSREFTRDVAAAKRASQQGAVFITDRGAPAYVLLNITEYHRLKDQNHASLLAVMNELPSSDGVEFEPEKLQFHSTAAGLD